MNICEYTMEDGSFCCLQVEGRTNYCATHNRILRKEQSVINKAVTKRMQLIEKQKAQQSLPRKKIKKVSDKMKDDLKVYSVLRRNYLQRYPDCQLRLNGCDGIATDIHHCAGRGINLNNVSTWKSACRECHMKLHDELTADEARELGLKTNPIDQSKPTI